MMDQQNEQLREYAAWQIVVAQIGRDEINKNNKLAAALAYWAETVARLRMAQPPEVQERAYKRAVAKAKEQLGVVL